MVEKVICPKCDSSSFTAAPHAYLPCPYCGQAFSMNGPDKRRHPRIFRETAFSLFLNGFTIQAATVDVSKSGARIRFISRFASGHDVMHGNILDIHVPELGIDSKAEVVWQHSNQDVSPFQTGIGVRFI